MLKYINRKGVEITHLEWRRLTLHTRYHRVRIGKVDAITVELSWVGVYLPNLEESPKLYLLRAYELNEKKAEGQSARHGDLCYKWLATEQEGILAFEELCDDLRKTK